MVSGHYRNSRYIREQIIAKIGGDGNIVAKFEIDRGHVDGPEIHSITDTGLIIIHNRDSGKLVTKLIARPGQIRRYYRNSPKTPPRDILMLAFKHQQLGYNLY